MFPLIRAIHVPIKTTINTFKLPNRCMSIPSFSQSSQSSSQNSLNKIKTIILNYIDTPDYQVISMFCMTISMFGTVADNYFAKESTSHHDNVVYIFTKGLIVGLTHPISFPLITLNFLYKNLTKTKQLKNTSILC
jgi:hypothetical protein